MANEKKNSNAALIRVHKTKNYTVMSNKHLFDKPPLSLKAKGLLCMFLALPEDWNYSINGLVAICKESRDAIKSTMDELKKFGYLYIEKIMPDKSESGRITYIYHISEQPYAYEQKSEGIEVQGAENTPLEFSEKQDLEKQALESQTLENQESENPQQLNINNEIIKNEITNNGSTNNQVIENASVFRGIDLFNLYKSICKSFPQPREFDENRAEKAAKRLKKRPSREFWEKVCRNAENSSFCKGANFFCFDWIIKNDNNAVKVFEGNYDDKRFKTTNKSVVVDFESSKYAKYHAEQSAAEV